MLVELHHEHRLLLSFPFSVFPHLFLASYFGDSFETGSPEDWWSKALILLRKNLMNCQMCRTLSDWWCHFQSCFPVCLLSYIVNPWQMNLLLGCLSQNGEETFSEQWDFITARTKTSVDINAAVSAFICNINRLQELREMKCDVSSWLLMQVFIRYDMNRVFCHWSVLAPVFTNEEILVLFVVVLFYFFKAGFPKLMLFLWSNRCKSMSYDMQEYIVYGVTLTLLLIHMLRRQFWFQKEQYIWRKLFYM